MIACIIQARMGSSRLPGKVLMDVGGRPMLAVMVDRVAHVRALDSVVVATTDRPQDDAIAAWCKGNGISCYRGSEDDVLDRYYQASRSIGARHGDAIVRLTADCPLIDPAIVDDVVSFFRRGRFDYAANTAPPDGSTYPDGMDAEIVTFTSLERACREATLPSEREHVTFHFWKNPDRFSTGRLDLPQDLSHMRLTVDYPEDLELVRTVVAALHPVDPAFTLADVVRFLDEHPDVTRTNAHVERNAGWKPALEADAAHTANGGDP